MKSFVPSPEAEMGSLTSSLYVTLACAGYQIMSPNSVAAAKVEMVRSKPMSLSTRLVTDRLNVGSSWRVTWLIT